MSKTWKILISIVWTAIAVMIFFSLLSLFPGCCNVEESTTQQSGEIITWIDSVEANYELQPEDVILMGDTVQVMTQDQLDSEIKMLDTEITGDVDSMLAVPDTAH